jgi:hypothetical protein
MTLTQKKSAYKERLMLYGETDSMLAEDFGFAEDDDMEYMLYNCNKGWDSKVLQKYRKREVIKKLYGMVQNPCPDEDDKPLILLGRMTKQYWNQINEGSYYEAEEIPPYYSLSAKPVYMALILERYDLVYQLCDVGYDLDYITPMQICTYLKCSEIPNPKLYKFYNFLPDFLLHQERIPESVEEELWRYIEVEYKVEKLEIPFMGKPYDRLDIIPNTFEGEKLEKDTKIYVGKVKKLLERHPVFFDHLGNAGYTWHGDMKQGYDLQLFLTEKLSNRIDVLEELPKIFGYNFDINNIFLDISYYNNRIEDFADYSRKLAKYYQNNEELQLFYFSWLLRAMVLLQYKFPDYVGGKYWKILISLTKQFWTGQHIADVCSYSEKLCIKGTAISSNNIWFKCCMLRCFSSLSPEPYRYIARKPEDVNWICRLLFPQKSNAEKGGYWLAETLEEEENMQLEGLLENTIIEIAGFEYQHPKLEENCYDKMKVWLRENDNMEERMQIILDSGLLSSRYIMLLFEYAVEEKRWEYVPLLLSRL